MSSQEGLTSLPAAARGPISAALGQDEPTYRVLGLDARNPAQRLRVDFSRAGVALASGSTHFQLSLLAYGHGGALERVARVSPEVQANRVSYPHTGIDEWYANGPLGLEQGFDVQRGPNGANGPLTLSLALSGDVRAQLERSGVVLDGPGATLRDGGLAASDARGRPLRSWFELRRGRLLIRVDDRDALYPLRIDPFLQQAELTASDGVARDRFGFSVAISGSTIVVGAISHGANEFQPAAYVFTMPASGWANATQSAELTASDGGAGDGFGDSVAISGSTIVVGAPYHTVGANGLQGAAYVFAMPASGWATATQSAELAASDGAVLDEFGSSVAISGSTIVVGAPYHTVGANEQQGAAYVFAMPASGWANATQSAELTASDGGAGDAFGFSVAISGSTIVAGARSHNVGANEHEGAAYVFTMPVSGWANASQSAELTASDGGAGNGFGLSVAISGSAIVAGSRFGGNEHQGAAYLFTMPASGWANATQSAELTASDGARGDGSDGLPVAISGSTIVVGTPDHTVGANREQGAAYAFVNPAPTITITSPANGATYTQGQSVAASYSCAASPPTTISACAAQVPNGAAIETATLGPHSFTVKATDSYGVETSQTATYNVAPAVPSSRPVTSSSAPATGSPPGSPSVGHVRVSGKNVHVQLSCNGPAGATCALSLDLSMTETRLGHRIVALSARKRPTKKVVPVGRTMLTLSAGQSKTVIVALNHTGASLLETHRQLPAKLTISERVGARNVIFFTRTLRFKLAKKRKR
jgi:hypothetical protein